MVSDGVRYNSVRLGDEPERVTMFASLRLRSFRSVFVGGLFLGTARWGLGFLAAYVANDLTGSPRAVQLTGAVMWMPLLFAGVVAGALADRWDRRLLVAGIVAVLAPASVLIGLAELDGALAVWMLYPVMGLTGLSWVIDITARRTLVLDIVGPRLIDNAMAIESLSTAVALASGVLAGGAVVDALGVGQAFLVLAGLLTIGGLLVGRSAKVDTDARMMGAGGDGGGGGTRAALANRTLVSVLGITVLANFFYFSHTPLVPVFAERLGASALGAGLLASAGGLGMMVAALLVAVIKPRRGPTYVFGAGLAMVAVIGLGLSMSFPLAFISLLVASTGFGLFGATQAASTMTSVEPALRGRAMGLLSMAIGALPIGMFTLGELAELIEPPRAVIAYAAVGIVTLIWWVVRRGEVLRAGEDMTGRTDTGERRLGAEDS